MSGESDERVYALSTACTIFSWLRFHYFLRSMTALPSWYPIKLLVSQFITAHPMFLNVGQKVLKGDKYNAVDAVARNVCK